MIKRSLSAALLFSTSQLAFAGVSGPDFSKVFVPDTIGPGSVSQLRFDIENFDNVTVTDIAFTDTLPAGVTIANPANVSTTCVDAIITAPDGGSTITFSDGELGSMQSCFALVDVTSSTVGTHMNTSGPLTSSEGMGDTASDDLTVATDRPGFSISFAPSTIALGGRSTLTYTIDNTANASALSSLVFSNSFPTGMVIASPANAAFDCGGPNPMLTANSGSSSLSFSSFGILFPGFEVLLAGASCTVTVDVVSVIDTRGLIGTLELDNVTSELTSDAGSSGKASATLVAERYNPHLFKSFTDDPVAPGATVAMDFTIYNFDRFDSASNIAFTDDLGAALAGLTLTSVDFNDCGGSVMGVGTTQMMFSGGSLAPEANCSINTTLTVPPGAAPGVYPNNTTAITADVGGSPETGNVASDDLFVSPAPVLTKTYMPDVVASGDSVVVEFTVTNTSSTSSATDLTFEDPFPIIHPSASVTPGNDCCGAGSTCMFTPLTNPPPPSSSTPSTLTITDGVLAPAGMPGDSCTFQITLDMDPGAATGIYTNTTSDVSATVDGATRVGLAASDDLEVVEAPILLKEFSGPADAGGSVDLTFTLVYPDEAPGDATGITFSDNLTATLDGLVATVTPTTCDIVGGGTTGTMTASAGNSLLTFSGGTLTPGQSCTMTATLSVPSTDAMMMPITPGDYPNTTSAVNATVSGLAVASQAATDDLVINGLNFTKEFIDDPVLAGEMVTLRFTLDNIHPSNDATSIFFTDDLAAVLPGTPDLSIVTALPLAACGGSLSVVGSTFLVYSGGSVLAGSPACSFDLLLQVPAGVADGSYTNTTSNLSYMSGGSSVVSGPATDPLVVNSDRLEIRKTFTDDPVVAGNSVTLEFELTNLDATQAITDIDFTDDLDAALTGLTYNGGAVAECGGTVDGLPGPGTINFDGGTLAAGASCIFSVTVDVPAAAPLGTYTNTTSQVTGMIGGLAVTGGVAADDLTVFANLNFSKTFDGPTTATGTATLTFTIENLSASTVSPLSFTDDLDAVLSGLVAVSLPPTPCGGSSSITGTSVLTFSAGEIPAMGMCSFDVDVAIPAGATAGTYPNTSSQLFQGGTPLAAPATADLTVEPAPAFAKTFAPDFIGLGQSSTLTFAIDNSASALAANSLAFNDSLPAGVIVATPSSTSNTCGGTLTATAGSGSINLSGGSVGAGSTCIVQVSVVGSAVGGHVNTTGDLTSSSGNSGTATDTLTVNPQPGFGKVFSPNPILVGGTSTLTFTIDNSASTVDATSLDFTDSLPTEIVVATPANAMTSCTGGTLTAVDGSGTLDYTGGTATAGTACTVSVDVTSSVAGTHTNTSGNLTSNLGSSGSASDTLTVNPPPSFTKVFAPSAIAIGDNSTLTFTIDNAGSTEAASSLDFTDNLPANVVVATPSAASTDCTGGTLTATDGSNVISYTGGSVPAGFSCTVTVDTTSTASGDHVNTTGDLTSSLGNSGSASDTLRVEPVPTFSKAFAPSAIPVDGTSTLTFSISNVGATTLAATNVDFTDSLPAGVVVATPSNATNNCSGGTLTATAGSGAISYTGGTVSQGIACTILVDVTSATAGVYVNTTGDLTSSLGNSGTASDTLTVDAPPLFSKAFSPADVPVDTVSTLTFVIDLSAAVQLDANNLAFTDTLPGTVVVATPPNAATDCLGGTLTATAGSGVISYSAGSLSQGSVCSVSVDVLSPSAGIFVNTSGDLTSSLGNSGTASDTLTVDAPPLFSKAFAPAAVAIDVVSTLTLTIDNTASNALDATALDFTDVLPGTVLIATPANASTTCTGGTLTAADGTATISYVGGSVAAGDSCTVTVDVSSASAGSFDNVSGDLTSSLGNSGTATANLTVEGAPGFSKAFTPSAVAIDAPSTLTFTIDNSSATVLSADNLDFTDNLPGTVVVASTPNASTTCTGGTLTAVAGASVISYNGGTVPAGAICTVDVDVSSASAGSFDNVSGDLTSSLGNSGNATANLQVEAVPMFAKAFSPDTVLVDEISTLTFTIDNSAMALSADNLDFTDNLPGSVVVAAAPNVVNTCSGGTVTAAPGSSVIAYSGGGSVAAASSCTISVDVSSDTGGVFDNVSGDLTSDLGNSGPATDTLTVAGDDLTFAKSFQSAPVIPGGSVDLQYTITNLSDVLDLTDLTFVDDYDAALSGLVIATLPAAGDCGVGSSFSGTTALTMTGGTVAPSDTCTFTVTLVVPPDAATDDYLSTSGTISGMAAGLPVSDGEASDTLMVERLGFTKAFLSDTEPGGTVMLSFTISNPDPINTASGISFSDDLIAMASGFVPTNLPQFDICGVGSSLTGGASFTLADGILAGGEDCSFTVDINISAVTHPGDYPNVTSPLQSVVGGNAVNGTEADTANAILVVGGMIIPIPTMHQWALLLMALLLAGIAGLRMRRV